MWLASSTTVGHLAQDVRYALRVLVKSRAFTAITILTVAIGTGANATVFSFLSALLFRPAPGVVNPAAGQRQTAAAAAVFGVQAL